MQFGCFLAVFLAFYLQGMLICESICFGNDFSLTRNLKNDKHLSHVHCMSVDRIVQIHDYVTNSNRLRTKDTV